MPAKDLGQKHTCWKCGTKFYDLKKADPACPKCGSDPRQAPVTKPAAEKRPRGKPPVEAPEVEEKDLDAEIDDLDEADAGDDDDDEPKPSSAAATRRRSPPSPRRTPARPPARCARAPSRPGPSRG